jgi:hypothetical protein
MVEWCLDRDPEPGLERLTVGCLTRVRPWDSGGLLLYREQGPTLVRIRRQRSEAQIELVARPKVVNRVSRCKVQFVEEC